MCVDHPRISFQAFNIYLTDTGTGTISTPANHPPAAVTDGSTKPAHGPIADNKLAGTGGTHDVKRTGNEQIGGVTGHSHEQPVMPDARAAGIGAGHAHVGGGAPNHPPQGHNATTVGHNATTGATGAPLSNGFVNKTAPGAGIGGAGPAFSEGARGAADPCPTRVPVFPRDQEAIFF